MTKNSRQKFKYFENDKKTFFIIFKEFSVAKKFMRLESVLLNVHLSIGIIFLYLISQFQFEIDCYMFG